MRPYAEQISLDWSRHKTVDIKKRGNLSILLPQTTTGTAPKARAEKPRCIWPSSLVNADSRFISRRVWGR